ncbi:FIG004851: hypothetical protein [invertebrate metagenome]|uniref:Uncharacterized protein n=1 Tax=invertebrate metagenome TaxID=1711999 RepID=A0A484H766_9ZZZZ
MIHYSLRCVRDHHFDEWFENSSDYENRASAGTIACPTCGDTHIDKAVMAPNVSGAGRSVDLPPSCGLEGCGSGMCGLGNIN